MLKKLISTLAIITMTLSFSYVSFNAVSNSNINVYAARKHHKINDTDEGFWQKFWDGLKYVQE
ncbi:hypothetical protein [Apilactobacillus quenuiae]|uniref:hypothetical protein n=1 Tax=Apilactobacillus quenuiae TaxID=2008377 RepID=UPI0012FFE8CA|nr:hypothetical protein [Apilactobacillus quenuiae]